MSGDYISREALLGRVDEIIKINHLRPDFVWFTPNGVKALALEIPAADVAMVRHGRWVVKGDAQPISSDKLYGCSLCGDKNRRYYEWQLSNYCPNCGAKMDGGQDDG